MTKHNIKIEESLFLLNDVLKANVLTFVEKFSAFDMEQFQDIITDAQKFADDQLAPLFSSDHSADPVQLNLGHVCMPENYKKAWSVFRDSDWFSLLASTPNNGKYIPDSIKLPLMEIFLATDLSFGLNVLQTAETARLLHLLGDSAAVKQYCKPVFSGLWTGAIASRSLQNINDLNQISLTAKAEKDHFSINGTEQFILAGDQDLGENVLYILPAKVKVDEKGGEKIGLFAVPKIQQNQKDHNSVVVDTYHSATGLPHLPCCDVNFGGIGTTRGHLLCLLTENDKTVQEILSIQQIYSIIIASMTVEQTCHLLTEIADQTRQLPEAEDLQKVINLPSNMETFMKLNALQKGLKGAIYTMMFYRDCMQHAAPEQQGNFRNLFEFYQTILKSYAYTAGARILHDILSLLGDAGTTQRFPVAQFVRDIISAGSMGGNSIQVNQDLISTLLKKDEGAVFKSFMDSIRDVDPQAVQTDPLKQSIMDWQDYLGGAFLLNDDLNKEEAASLGAIYANRINHFLGTLLISGSLVRQGIAAEQKLLEMGANLLHLKQESKRDNTVKELFEKLLFAEFFNSHVLTQEESIIRAVQKKSASAIEDFFS